MQCARRFCASLVVSPPNLVARCQLVRATVLAAPPGLSSLKSAREQGGGLSAAALYGVNPSMAQAVVGAHSATRPRSQEFLAYQKRGWFERATYAAGCSYLAGIALGGTKGFFVGLSQSPSPRFRVRLNSVLNGCGRGARLGNALGVLAMFYTTLESGFDTLEVDKHLRVPGSDWVSPTLAATATGIVYRSTAGAGIAAASGIVGAGTAGIVLFGMPWLARQFPGMFSAIPSFSR